jgi:hypothetical protein
MRCKALLTHAQCFPIISKVATLRRFEGDFALSEMMISMDAMRYHGRFRAPLAATFSIKTILRLTFD